MSTRTAAAILEDWRLLSVREDEAEGDRSPGWHGRAAFRAERMAALFDEAQRLVPVPAEIALHACGFAALYHREFARRMRATIPPPWKETTP